MHLNPSLIPALHAYMPLPSSIGALLRHLCLVTNTVVSVNPRAKKFNIVRNDHGHMQRCKFSVLDRKHPFWANSAQNIKIVSLG